MTQWRPACFLEGFVTNGFFWNAYCFFERSLEYLVSCAHCCVAYLLLTACCILHTAKFHAYCMFSLLLSATASCYLLPLRRVNKTDLIGAEKVIVVVKAPKEIPKTALVWSLTYVSAL